MLTREDDVDAHALRRMTTRSASPSPRSGAHETGPRELVLKADFAAAVAAIFYALIVPV
jgi:hypothetical protein